MENESKHCHKCQKEILPSEKYKSDGEEYSHEECPSESEPESEQKNPNLCEFC